MLKGKTIQNTQNIYNMENIQNEIEHHEVKNTVSSSAPTLMPKKIINSASSYDPIQSTINLKPSKSIANSANYHEPQIIKKTNNIRYSVQELKTLFPGFENLYYTEIFDLLQETDFEITPENLNLNLMKFINVGNNVQSQISRLNEILNFLPVNSFEKIKEQSKGKISFFTSNSDIFKVFNEFNTEIFNLHSSLYIELQKIKNLNFNKYNLIYLYFDFFKFISDEIKSKQIVPDDFIASSVISSRVISLNNSITLLNQFKTLIKIEISSKELELNNLKNYLDVLKPSLCLLEHQDFKKFREQFKTLLN